MVLSMAYTEGVKSSIWDNAVYTSSIHPKEFILNLWDSSDSPYPITVPWNASPQEMEHLVNAARMEAEGKTMVRLK